MASAFLSFTRFACRNPATKCLAVVVLWGLTVMPIHAQDSAERSTDRASAATAFPAASSANSSANPSAISAGPTQRAVRLSWRPERKPGGRLSRENLGLVINSADPYSVEVGRYYIQQRQLNFRQVLYLDFEPKSVMSPDEFEIIRAKVQQRFGSDIQALALAWRRPWAVACNSITSAMSLGFQSGLCVNTCGRTDASRLYRSSTARPFTDYGVRPSMLLAAPSVEEAKQMIERGVVSDGSLGRSFSPSVVAVFQRTPDAARSRRAASFPPPGLLPGRVGILLDQVSVGQPEPPAHRNLMLLLTGYAKVPGLDKQHFVPGAVADHLTSFGGALDGGHGHTLATDWISAGATASFGTVSEPCNYPEKFPEPQVLLQNLLFGSTVLEAYWRSVAWPAQGLLVGEPLAAPFAGAGLNFMPESAASSSQPASRPD